MSLPLLVALALSSCGYAPSGSSAVRSWISQNSFVASERQVVSDARSLERAARTGSALELRTVCGGLSADAGTIYGNLPTPNRRLTGELGTSMEDLFQAAETCAVSSSTHNTRTKRALHELEAGIAALRAANATLSALRIRSARVGHM